MMREVKETDGSPRKLPLTSERVVEELWDAGELWVSPGEVWVSLEGCWRLCFCFDENARSYETRRVPIEASSVGCGRSGRDWESMGGVVGKPKLIAHVIMCGWGVLSLKSRDCAGWAPLIVLRADLGGLGESGRRHWEVWESVEGVVGGPE